MSSNGIGAEVLVKGESSADAAGQSYRPGKFLLAQAGHPRTDLPLEAVLRNVAENASQGKTKLMVELRAESFHIFGPRLVFDVTSMHLEPKSPID
jgi:hypothetical protein